MFRKINDHRYTAQISKDGTVVTVKYDEGWEDILAFRKIGLANAADARAFLIGEGYEQYDPNAGYPKPYWERNKDTAYRDEQAASFDH
jgi:hypothetical protein